jgi:DNA invertase Pin-like site-specific DNA recombinase
MMTRRVALYLRVSTSEQTTENQRAELSSVAARHGWDVVATFEDAGISGAKGRDKRPGFDQLLRAVSRREVDLVGAWSVDRLSRSLPDLVGFLGDLRAKGVDLYLHRQNLDTSTPSGRALFGMLGVFAEFERSMIAERVRAGMARARSEGRHVGRKPVDPMRAARARDALLAGASIRAAAEAAGLGHGTVARLRASMGSPGTP